MNVMPERLFRFQTVNEQNLEALRQKKFWFSSVDRFNDPFEFYCDPLSGVLPMQLPKEEEDQLQLIDQVCQHTGEQHRAKVKAIIETGSIGEFRSYARTSMHEAIRTHLLTVGVCCFFPCIKNGLFWSHYGDSHRGFAIGLTIRKVDLTILKLEKVVYLNSPPRIIQSYDGSMAWKSSNWSHEQEWRFLAPRANRLLGHGDGNSLWPICEIYFGGRMAGVEKRRIRDVAGNGLAYFDVVFNPETYGLTLSMSKFETANEGF